MRSSQPACVVRAWRSGSASFCATSACSAMLRTRLTSGSQVAIGNSHIATQAHP